MFLEKKIAAPAFLKQDVVEEKKDVKSSGKMNKAMFENSSSVNKSPPKPSPKSAKTTNKPTKAKQPQKDEEDEADEGAEYEYEYEYEDE